MKKEPVRPDENADSRELVASRLSLVHSRCNGRDAFSLRRVQKSIRLFSGEQCETTAMRLI